MTSSSIPFLFSTMFQETYKCYSVSGLEKKRNDVEYGGKIILPQSALVFLTQRNIPSPMLFKLINTQKECSTHVGVLEFTADEGTCYIPEWLQNFLELTDGDNLNVEHISLPIATFAKFQPIGVEFLDITNPKAVLENELRRFACLTVGDVITIHYNQHTYKLRVLELSPATAVNIIVCDMHVDFEQPEGYVDPNAPKSDSSLVGLNIVASFEGKGVRLDGKNKKQQPNVITRNSTKRSTHLRGIPDFSYNFGELLFLRNSTPALMAPTVMQATASALQFPGSGFTVREEEVD